MRIDCHCHTIYSRHFLWGSDALSTPLDMVKTAIKKGMNGLAITDHNTVRGSLIARQVARRFNNFLIVTGAEIRTKEGEIIALGIKENVPTKLSIEETVEKIHDLGGIATAPHPFGNYVFRRCAGRKSVIADAIEVYNSTLTKGQNAKALDLARTFKKSFTAGSDAHSSREVGNAGIVFEGDPLEDILRKKVKIFGRHTSLFEVAYRSTRKFTRSVEWRITGRRKNYV